MDTTIVDDTWEMIMQATAVWKSKPTDMPYGFWENKLGVLEYVQKTRNARRMSPDHRSTFDVIFRLVVLPKRSR